MARQPKTDLAGQWALVTGASSGFGVDFAHLLAERGANLVLVARRVAPMKALARELKQGHGIDCRAIPMDLAHPGVGDELLARLDADGIAVDILINNAGYGVFGEFIDQPIEAHANMLQLNVVALTELTHAFGGDMAERGGGHILLVGSLGGFQPLPTYAAYAASKAYVLSFGEALHVELKPRGVGVTVLWPGAARTNFLSVAGQDNLAFADSLLVASRPVADIGLKAMFAGRPSVVPGLANKSTAFSNRVLPRSFFPKLAYRLLKR